MSEQVPLTEEQRVMEAVRAYCTRVDVVPTDEPTVVRGSFYAVNDGRSVLVVVRYGRDSKKLHLPVARDIIRAAERRGARLDLITVLFINEPSDNGVRPKEQALLRHVVDYKEER